MDPEVWIFSGTWRYRSCRGSMDLIIKNLDIWILRKKFVKDPIK